MDSQEEIYKLREALAAAQKACAEEEERVTTWRGVSMILGFIILVMWASDVISHWK